jgi:hypothetical protein
MKYCSKCCVLKEEKEFSKLKQNKDGMHCHCKECHNLYNRKYNKIYRQTEKYKESRKKDDKNYYRRHPEKFYEATKRMRKKYPQKYKARGIVNDALHYKKISKLPCEVCGELKVEAHHEDYNKPLDIIWLCIKHHKDLHKKQKQVS